MTDKKVTPETIDDAALDDVNGGIGLLLPAVQKVREAAARAGGGSVKPVAGVAQQSFGSGI